MAYELNGKIYTDNPMVDEIVHNAKLIMKEIVLKDSDTADYYETEESIYLSDIYIAIKKSTIRLSMIDIDRELIRDTISDISEEDIRLYLSDNTLIPKDIQDKLLSTYIDQFKYTEYNAYYRELYGLPPLGTDPSLKAIQNIHIRKDELPEVIRDAIDTTKAIHEMSIEEINLLYNKGIIDNLKKKYPTAKYLDHLGVKAIDPFIARTANRFDILYIPSSAEKMVSNRFQEIYEKNRLLYLKRHYSKAFKYQSEHYDAFFALMLVSQTVTDLIAEIPEWYIRRDVFDSRTVQYILESNGVKYFPQIPLKYQISLVRSLNRIVKYKSCNRNITDIANVFDFKDVELYKYYIFKTRKMDLYSKQYAPQDGDDIYDLFFVRSPIGGTLIDSISNNENILEYDHVVTEDPLWDGVDGHDTVKQNILDKNFTYETSKYISLEIDQDMTHNQFGITYFLNLFLNNAVDTSNLRIDLTIDGITSSACITDVLIMLYVFTFNFGENRISDEVHYTENVPLDPFIEDENIITIYDLIEEDGNANIDNGEADTEDFSFTANGLHAYISDRYSYNVDGNDNPFIYVDNTETSVEQVFLPLYHPLDIDFNEDGIYIKNHIISIDLRDRIMGFNLEANLDFVKELVSLPVSKYNFLKGMTLEELGIDMYRVPDDNAINDISTLIEIYRNNTKAYDNLKEMILNANNQYEKELYLFLYYYLFTMKKRDAYITLPDGTKPLRYSLYLSKKNPILYNYYLKLMSEENGDVRRTQISACLDDIIDTLEAYLECPEISNIWTFVASRSSNVIIGYIKLLIEFFKSYKVSFIDLGVNTIMNDPVDNSAKPNDAIRNHMRKMIKSSTYNTLQNITIYNREFTRKDNIRPADISYKKDTYIGPWYDLDGWKAQAIASIDYDGNDSSQYTAHREKSREFDEYDDFDLDGGDAYSEIYIRGLIELDGGTADNVPKEEYKDLGIADELDGGDASFKPFELDADGHGAIDKRIELIVDGGREYIIGLEYWNPEYHGYDCDGFTATDGVLRIDLDGGTGLNYTWNDNEDIDVDGGRDFILPYQRELSPSYLNDYDVDGNITHEDMEWRTNGLYAEDVLSEYIIEIDGGREGYPEGSDEQRLATLKEKITEQNTRLDNIDIDLYTRVYEKEEYKSNLTYYKLIDGEYTPTEVTKESYPLEVDTLYITLKDRDRIINQDIGERDFALARWHLF